MQGKKVWNPILLQFPDRGDIGVESEKFSIG